MVEEPRKCTVCRESKPEGNFYTKGKTRKSYTCKPCHNEKARLRRIKRPATPKGGWTVDNLQEYYDNSGSDVTVIAVGRGKDFRDAGFDVAFPGWIAYV
jgi:glucan-binding YG repeat protein